MRTCRDCGSPNPWFDQVLEDMPPQGPSGMLTGLFRGGDSSHVARTLLYLGALDLSFLLITVLSLTAMPWSEKPVSTRIIDVGALAFGVGNLALAFYADLERPVWRALGTGMATVNLLGFFWLMGLD